MSKHSGKGLREYLLDLVEWGGKTARSVERTGRDTIAQDEHAELALARAVEIVGEIAGRIMVEEPETSRARFGQDLSNAYRLRNRLAHGYDNVSPEMLYDIAREHVPALVETAHVWLTDLEHDQP